MALSLWVKLGKGSNNGAICTKGFGSGGESWLLDISGHDFRFVRRDATPPNDYKVARSNRKVKYGVWQHVVCVDSGSELIIYVDGKTSGSTPYPAKASLVNSEIMSLGCRQSGKDEFDTGITGSIGEVTLWANALSATDVAGLYALRNKITERKNGEEKKTPLTPDQIRRKKIEEFRKKMQDRFKGSKRPGGPGRPPHKPGKPRKK